MEENEQFNGRATAPERYKTRSIVGHWRRVFSSQGHWVKFPLSVLSFWERLHSKRAGKCMVEDAGGEASQIESRNHWCNKKKMARFIAVKVRSETGKRHQDGGLEHNLL